MSTQPMTSTAALFGRIFWMLAGPPFLIVIALYIAQRRTGWFTLLDLAYFLVLGGMLLGRWLEFRSGDARTTMGDPATPADIRRYMMFAPLAGLALWVLVNLIGNHWLGQ
jgi:hypothetical protein